MNHYLNTTKVLLNYTTLDRIIIGIFCLQFMLQFQIDVLQRNILQTIASFLRLLGKLSNPMGINVNKFLIARYCFILENKLACNNTLLSIILYFQKIEKK